MPLTVEGLAKLTAPGRYGDGNGLYLQVGKDEGRAWLLRYVLREKDGSWVVVYVQPRRGPPAHSLLSGINVPH